MAVKKERAHPALDAHDDRSGAPSLRSADDSNGTASGLQASPSVTSSLLSMGNSSTARLRPALSAPLAPPPVLSGAVSPSVAAIGFWVSGGTAAYVKYGPHGKELDPVLRTVLVVATIFGLMITTVMVWFTCSRDRALKRTFRQENTYAYGGMVGLVGTLLAQKLVDNMFMTVLIPESLSFMAYLVPESYPVEMISGFLVSSCRLGFMLGTMAAYPLTSGRWNQRRLKHVLVACMAIFIVALAILAATCYEWKKKTPEEYPAKAQTERIAVLLSCQFIAGTAQGLIGAIGRLMLARVTPPSSQVTMAILNAVLICAGTGLGPMLSNAVRQGMLNAGTETYPGDVGGVSVAVVTALSCLWLAALALFVPASNEGVPVPLGAVRGPDSQTHLGQFIEAGWTDEQEAQKEAAQKLLFVTYLAVQTERAWLVAGLEVVTAMVMEQEFEISHRDIGFAVGSCFMIATPLIMLGAYAKQVLQPATLVLSLGVAVPLCCLLIFHFPADALHLHGTSSLGLLLSADTLIYPSALTLGSIIQGLALGYAIIPGSRIYSSSVAVIASEILISGVGRFMSMPISRLLVANGGRDTYAAVQLGMSILSLLSCIKVLPAVRLLVPVSTASRSSSRAPSRPTSRPPTPPPDGRASQSAKRYIDRASAKLAFSGTEKGS